MTGVLATPPSEPRAPESMPGRPWLAHYEPGVPAEIEVPEITVDQLLRQTAERFADRDALIFFGARTRFRELDRAVDRFAHTLRRMGLEKGDRVSLHLPTSPAMVIALLGTMRAGGIVVPMNPLYVEREVALFVGDTGARFSVCLDLLVPRMRAAHALMRSSDPSRAAPQLIVTGIRDSLPIPKRWLYPIKARREGRWNPVPHTPETPNLFRLLEEAPDEPFESAAEPADPAVLQPTGGTTGTPKTAILTHRNLVANTHQVAAWFPTGTAGEGSILCTLPFFHIYGLSVAMNYALLMGITQILLPRFEPEVTLEAIHRYKPRLFPGAPIMYARLLEEPKLGKYDLTSIEACISGAAPLPVLVQERFEHITGGRVSEGYGLTEASPVTHCNPIHGERRMGSVGLPFPSTEAQIVDLETGKQVLPVGEAGELCIRGPQVFSGYWNRPEETAGSLRDGWLHTGDVAAMDSDGYFRILDRMKDLIEVGGINVYPREIEDVLHAHPAVAEATIVGEPHPIKGEVPRAYVVLRPDATATEEELLAYCRLNLARYKVPVAIEIRAELPRTMIGKVQRWRLAQERAAAQAAEATRRPETPGG